MPYLFIKLAVDEGVSPLFLGWGRIAVGPAVSRNKERPARL